MTPLLLLTHLFTAAAASALTYFITLRYVAVREVDGHPVLEIHHHPPSGDPVRPRRSSPSWVGVILVMVACVLVAAGLQLKVAQESRDTRDAQDRQYADCLTQFATDLVSTIKARNDATAKVTAAETARDDAVDQVLEVVDRARQNPPAAGESDFDRVLARARAARLHLASVKREAELEKAKNEYVYPKAVCSR